MLLIPAHPPLTLRMYGVIEMASSRRRLLTLLFRHLFVHFEEAFEAGFVGGEGVAGVAALYDVVETVVSFEEVLGHGVGIVEVGERLAHREVGFAGEENVRSGFLYLGLLLGTDAGEGEGVVAEYRRITNTRFKFS